MTTDTRSEGQTSFERTVLKIALPVTFQSLLQSSFSAVDQVMIGQLGSNSIAGIGLGGKFASLYSVVLAAVASAAGIMISQYIGKKDERNVARSCTVSLLLSVGLALLFLIPCLFFAEGIMAFYTDDMATRLLAAKYIRLLSLSFLPLAISSVVTTLLRCMEAAALPLYAGIFALFLNTGLNYLLIFGRGIFPKMGVAGAATASVIAQTVSCIMICLFFLRHQKRRGAEKRIKLSAGWRQSNPAKVPGEASSKPYMAQYLRILWPLFICEFLWSLGENVYTAIYGKMGTAPCAAMTMTIPIQTIVIGALSGLAQAAGILIGKYLGREDFEEAYRNAKKLMGYGLAASLFLSLLLLAVGPYYVELYRVEATVQQTTRELFAVIALIAPVKVLNMILGGGILRSGGKTKYTLWIDMTGTWLFGVPLGLLSAFVLGLPIPLVYLMLSLEECVRLGISLVLFRKKTWMESIR